MARCQARLRRIRAGRCGQGAHQRRVDEALVLQLAVAHQKLRQLAHVGRRGGKLRGRTQILRHGRLRHAMLEVAHGQARISLRARLRDESKRAVRHAQRLQQLRIEVALIRLARDLLYHHAQQAISHVRIRIAAAGPRTHAQQTASAVKSGGQRRLRRRVQAERLPETHVVEAGRVRQQVADAHGVAGLPRVVQRQLRQHLLHGRVEREPVFADQAQDAQRQRHLAHGAHLHARVGLHG